MSASEAIWAPNGLQTPNLRASAPSRPPNTTQAIRQAAAPRAAPCMARKIASRPRLGLHRVHPLATANRTFRATVCSPGSSEVLSAAGATTAGPVAAGPVAAGPVAAGPVAAGEAAPGTAAK